MTTIDSFRHSSNLVTFAPGEVILREGDPGNIMYAVVEGQVEISAHGKYIDTTGPGGIIGEMALLDDAPRSATVVAKTECKLEPIDERRFMFLVQQTPFFALQVMRIMAERLRKLLAA